MAARSKSPAPKRLSASVMESSTWERSISTTREESIELTSASSSSRAFACRWGTDAPNFTAKDIR